MTVRRRTLEAAAAQERVVEALLSTGDKLAAARLQRCMEAMTTRRQDGGWPWTCRSAGCAWCGRSLARRWWTGMRHWIAQDGAQVSLAVLPMHHRPRDLRSAVVRLRRALRDVRDRAARRRAPWRRVALAGMAAGGAAHVLVRHPGVERAEIAEALLKRWPDSLVGDAGAAEPPWAIATEDAAALVRARRGAEPLRIVVLPQHAAEPAASGVAVPGEAAFASEPMPTAF